MPPVLELPPDTPAMDMEDRVTLPKTLTDTLLMETMLMAVITELMEVVLVPLWGTKKVEEGLKKVEKIIKVQEEE